MILKVIIYFIKYVLIIWKGDYLTNVNNILQVKELKIFAKSENEDVVCDFVENILERYRVDFKFKFKFELVIRELFTHLIKYSGESLKIRCMLLVDPLRLAVSFHDKNKEFNPLILLSDDGAVEEVVSGGFSMHLIRNNIDNIYYEYSEDGVNILTIEKLFNLSK